MAREARKGQAPWPARFQLSRFVAVGNVHPLQDAVFKLKFREFAVSRLVL
jgi:hypothetical protein